MTCSSVILAEIAIDNSSGSASIFGRAIEYLEAVLNEVSSISPADQIASVTAAARSLAEAQSDMAQLHNLAATVIAELRSSDRKPSNLPDRLSSFLRSILDDDHHAFESAAARAGGLIEPGQAILTISNSSLVRETICRHPAMASLTVVIPESRPMCEGVELAKSLDSMGVKTILTTDFAATTYVEKSDVFICGADAVTEDYVVNKIGTGAVAELAKQLHKKTITVFTSSKMIRSDCYGQRSQHRPAEEVADLRLLHGKVDNIYFERCPISVFSHLVSERSVYTSESLRADILIRPALVL